MLDQWYRKIEQRVLNMIDRGIVTKISEGDTQTCALSYGEDDDTDDVERVQNYGFSSYPGENAQAVVLHVSGTRDFPLIISADHPELRYKVAEWETALWTKFDTHFHLKADQTADLKAGKLNVELSADALIKAQGFKVDSPTATFTADKFSVKNAAGDDLISLLTDLVTALSTAAVPIGPPTGTPLTSNPQILALVPRISAFKG